MMRIIVLIMALLVNPLSAGKVGTRHFQPEHIIPAMLVMRTFMIQTRDFSEGIIQFMDPPLTGSSSPFSGSGGSPPKQSSDQNQDNGSDDEDGEENPEDFHEEDKGDSPDKEHRENRLMAESVEAFRKLLTDIGKEIERRKIKLILVFNLDGTLYRVPSELPAPVSFNLDGTLYRVPSELPESLSAILSPEQLLDLQQQWFRELAVFHKLHAPRVIVIYNTARSSLSNTKNCSIAVLKDWTDPKATFSSDIGRAGIAQAGAKATEEPNLIPFQPFQQSYYSSKLGMQGLPRPDALISNAGRVITVTGALARSMRSEQLNRVNRELNRQYFVTLDEVDVRHGADFQNLPYSLMISPTSTLHMAVVQEPHLLKYRQAFEKTFYTSERTTAICPSVKNDHRYLAEFITGKNIYLSSVANKGSSLCLLLEMMTSYLLADETPPENILEIVFGGSPMDLPMLLPHKEVLATSAFPEHFLHVRNSVFVPFGLTQNFTEPPYWRLSVVSNNRLFERHGSYVKQALQHPKVVRHAAPGLPGLLQPVLTMLRQER